MEEPAPSFDPQTVVVSGQISQNMTGLRLSGVEVCVFEHTEVPCTFTDDFGRFVLEGVPANRELMISMKREGHIPALRMLATGSTAPPELLREWMSPFEDALLTVEHFGVSYRDEPASVTLWNYVPELGLGFWAGGVRVVDPLMDLPPETVGPNYVDRRGFWIVREETDRNIGVAGYLNFPTDRIVELQLVSESMECELASPWGWPGTAPDRFRVRAVPGWNVNAVNMACEGGERCSYSDDARRTARPAVVRVANRSTRTLRLTRVDSSCLDIPAESELIAAGETRSIFSFVGYAYRFYDAEDGERLDDFYVSGRAEPDGEPFLVVYED